MLRIDNNLLIELGLGSLPDSEKNSLLKHVYDTLEMRVGMRLADQMSNDQLDEFERYYESKDDAGAFKWLETNFPNYKDIVQEEFDKLKGEVAQSAPQILTSSTQVPSTSQTQPNMAPTQGDQSSNQMPTNPQPQVQDDKYQSSSENQSNFPSDQPPPGPSQN